MNLTLVVGTEGGIFQLLFWTLQYFSLSCPVLFLSPLTSSCLPKVQTALGMAETFFPFFKNNPWCCTKPAAQNPPRTIALPYTVHWTVLKHPPQSRLFPPLYYADADIIVRLKIPFLPASEAFFYSIAVHTRWTFLHHIFSFLRVRNSIFWQRTSIA